MVKTIIPLAVSFASIMMYGLGIGAVSAAVICEYVGTKDGREGWELFSQRLTKFVLVVVTAVGMPAMAAPMVLAVALVPVATAFFTGVFLRHFLLAWLFVMLQWWLLSLYVSRWNSLRKERKKYHVALGAFSVVCAIAGFTSITWIMHAAFFGKAPTGISVIPGFFAHLGINLALSCLIGALFAQIVLMRTRWADDIKHDGCHLFGAGTFLAALCLIPLSAWFLIATPSPFKSQIMSALFLRQQPLAMIAMITTMVMVILLQSQLAMKKKHGAVRILILPSLVVSCTLLLLFQQARGAMAGPFLIRNSLYDNGLLVAEASLMKAEGIATAASPFITNTATSRGREVFRRCCASCHSLAKSPTLSAALHGKSEESIGVIIMHLADINSLMPPFPGTEADRQSLALFLDRFANEREIVGKGEKL